MSLPLCRRDKGQGWRVGARKFAVQRAVGWKMGLFGLAIHLANPTEPKPDATDFATSPDSRAFIAGSSEGWAQAAIAAGIEPVAAQASATRVTAFYTGEVRGCKQNSITWLFNHDAPQ